MKKIVGSMFLSLVLVTMGVSTVNGLTSAVPSNTVSGNTRTVVYSGFPTIGRTERVYAQVGNTKNYSPWQATGFISAKASGNKSLSSSYGSEAK